MRRATLTTLCLCLFTLTACRSVRLTPTTVASARLAPLVLTTDFGLRDGAVGAMRGVAATVEPGLMVSDLTHEIPPFDVGQAALRLQQSYRFWPAGTVFVTVVDPGVGSARRSVVVRTKSGHYFVGPDNGYLTAVINESGVDGVRVIDESKSRRPGSETSFTFHGRDIYAYVGAQLASGQRSFEQVGAESAAPLVRLNLPPAEIKGGVIYGTATVLDVNFGNVWTNVPHAALLTAFPNARELRVYVAHRGQKAFAGTLPVVATFNGVPRGQPLIYVNGLMNLALAINQGNFARTHHVDAGPEWTIVFSKP